MLALHSWASRNGISAAALADLKSVLGATTPREAVNTGGTQTGETAVQTKIRLEASAKGLRMWRNNVGATMDAKGNFIRYGLANDTPAMNKKVKSSDLIGIRPVVITADHIGHTIGQFVAREVKAPGWVYTGTEREAAQLKFIELIISMGGDARFTDREGTL